MDNTLIQSFIDFIIPQFDHPKQLFHSLNESTSEEDPRVYYQVWEHLDNNTLIKNHIALSIQLGTDVEVFTPNRRKKMAYNTWRRKTNDPQLMKS
jgi:hypothetical protein